MVIVAFILGALSIYFLAKELSWLGIVAFGIYTASLAMYAAALVR